jgi:Ring finger domain
MTIFRQDFTAGFFAAFVILSFVKIFHWMIQDRVDFIETTPNVTRSQHVRIVAFICLLIGIDYALLHYALTSTLSKGVSINLLFAFEYAIQISTALATLCKYTLSVIDMAMEGRWQGKGVAVFYLELALDLLHLITYTAFFTAVFTTYGIPIHLVRDLYWTFRNFQTRVRDFLRYRQVAAIMEHRFPDATAEDLTRADHVCIVCREDMGPGSRAKKLDCSHCFHVHCLRSWLERQQNCPICRAPVLAAVDTARRDNHGRRQGGVGGAAGGVGNGVVDNNNNEPAAAEGGAPAAAGGVGADHDHDRMFDLHALLGLDDELMGGGDQGGPPGPILAGRQDAAGIGLRWRGPQQQNGNAAAAPAAAPAGGQPPLHPMHQQHQIPYGMYPYNMLHPQQEQQQQQQQQLQQQFPYGYPYTPPPAFAFPQQQQWQGQQQQQQQQVRPTAVPNSAESINGDTQGTPAVPLSAPPASSSPQQQQAQNFTATGAQPQHPHQPQSPMMPSFFPIPVLIPVMASPGPHTPIPGSHSQPQQATPEQHAMAAALAAAATAAATMSMPFMMVSPPPPTSAAAYSSMPIHRQQMDADSPEPPSSATPPPVVPEKEQTQAAPAMLPPEEEAAAAAAAAAAAPPAPIATSKDDDEAEQLRRRRLERFQNGASGSGASNL